MQFEGIGELIDRATQWLLVYDRCGHDQELFRESLDNFTRVEKEIRRHFAPCLTCRLAERRETSEDSAA